MNFHSRRRFLSWSVAGMVAAKLSHAVAGSARAPIVLYRGPGPIELGLGATHVRLRPDWGGAVNLIDPRYFLVLTGLSQRRPSGVRYDVYLDRGDTPSAHPSHRAGSLTFGAGDIRLDVTALARHWPPDTENLTLSIIPLGAPDPNTAPRIDALAIVT